MATKENDNILLTSSKITLLVLLLILMACFAFFYSAGKFPVWDLSGTSDFFSVKDAYEMMSESAREEIEAQEEKQAAMDSLEEDDDVDFDDLETIKDKNKHIKPDFDGAAALSASHYAKIGTRPGTLYLGNSQETAGYANSSAKTQTEKNEFKPEKLGKSSISSYAKLERASGGNSALRNISGNKFAAPYRSKAKAGRTSAFSSGIMDMAHAKSKNRTLKPFDASVLDSSKNLVAESKKAANRNNSVMLANSKKPRSGNSKSKKAGFKSGSKASEQAKDVNLKMQSAKSSGSYSAARDKSDEAWEGKTSSDGSSNAGSSPRVESDSSIKNIGGSTPSANSGSSSSQESGIEAPAPSGSEDVTPWDKEMTAVQALFGAIMAALAVAAILFDAESMASVVGGIAFCSIAAAASVALIVLAIILMSKYKQKALGGIWLALGTACLCISIGAMVCGIKQGSAIRQASGVISEAIASSLKTLMKFLSIVGVAGGIGDAYMGSVNEKTISVESYCKSYSDTDYCKNHSKTQTSYVVHEKMYEIADYPEAIKEDRA